MRSFIKRVRTKSGIRKDLKRFFRSAWEANVQRYLLFLQKHGVALKHGKIVKIEYEVQEFEFPVKRGNRYYKPDFRVWYEDGEYEWWEVKGFMDNDSRVKLKRFKQYWPREAAKLMLIDAKAYNGIKKRLSRLIQNWE